MRATPRSQDPTDPEAEVADSLEARAGALVPAGEIERAHRFILRKNLLTLFGAKFRVYDPDWRLLLFCRQKAFKLKEDIRVFADEAETKEVLSIKARQIIDFGAAYDVVHTPTKRKLGVLRRKGWSSLVRDEWEVLDDADRPIGKIEEDSLVAALVRRLILAIIPQSYTISLNGRKVGEIHQHWNPFVFRATMDLTHDPKFEMPRLLAIAAGILMLAIEGRQK